MNSITTLLLGILLLAASAATSTAQMAGHPHAPAKKMFRLTAEGGAILLGGDLTRESGNYSPKGFGGVELSYTVTGNLAIGLYGQIGSLASSSGEKRVETDFTWGGGLIEFRVPVRKGTLFPFLQLKVATASFKPTFTNGDNTEHGARTRSMVYGVGAGIETIFKRTLGVRFTLGVVYSNSDNWDMLNTGSDFDGMSYASLAVSYYLKSLFQH